MVVTRLRTFAWLTLSTLSSFYFSPPPMQLSLYRAFSFVSTGDFMSDVISLISSVGLTRIVWKGVAQIIDWYFWFRSYSTWVLVCILPQFNTPYSSVLTLRYWQCAPTFMTFCQVLKPCAMDLGKMLSPARRHNFILKYLLDDPRKFQISNLIRILNAHCFILGWRKQVLVGSQCFYCMLLEMFMNLGTIRQDNRMP